MAWQWDAERRRYRNAETGRLVSEKRVVAWRDSYIGIRASSIQGLTENLIEDNMSRQAWEREMQAEIKGEITALYMLGRGGRNAMQPSDETAIEGLAQEQLKFLRGFSNDIKRGRVTAPQALARARMYAGSGVLAFERGRAAAHGLPDLPQYPGDGQTVCRSNCRCHLAYEQDGDDWLVYWHLGAAEHCPDCEAMASSWAPLRIEASGELRESLPAWEGDPSALTTSELSAEARDAVRQWREGLTEDQWWALYEYQASADPFQYALLLGENTEDWLGPINALIKALETAPQVTDHVVWRGFKMRNLSTREAKRYWQRRVGTKVFWGGFASASEDPSIAAGFANSGPNAGGVVFELRHRGVPHVLGSAVESNDIEIERECIFPPGTTWRIDSVRTADTSGPFHSIDNVTIVTMRQIE